MKIITLSGVDGSGKSTQLAKLRTFLESQGHQTAYMHAVAFSFSERARLLFTRSNKTTALQSAKTKSGLIGVLLRKAILLVDLIRFRFFMKQLEKSGVQYLLSDRYFYDTLVNIAYLDGTELNTSFSRLAARFIPKPDKAFYLKVTPEQIMGRSRKPEQGLRYLKDKTLLFSDAANTWSFITLDANQPIEIVFEALKQRL